MKKIKVMLASLAIAGLTLTSCSSDDSSGSSASIVGKWTPTKTITKVGKQSVTQVYDENETGCDKDYVEFKESLAFDNVVYAKNADGQCTTLAAASQTYAKTDDNLTINGGEYEGTYDIKKLSGSDLQVSNTESLGGNSIVTTVYFKKVTSSN